MREWSPLRAYAPKKHLFCWQDNLTALLLLGGMFWLFFEAWQMPGYKWNWRSCLDFLYLSGPSGEWKAGLLLQGLFTTLRAGFWTFLFSLIFGGLCGLYAAGRPLKKIIIYQTLINLLRNTPPLIILFCMYLLAGMILPVASLEAGIQKLPDPVMQAFYLFFAPHGQLDRMIATVLALGLYQGAYVAEIVRGSLNGVPTGQWDAGYALGFNRKAILWLIILPQAARSALAPLTGQCVSTFKDSSLASLISLPDLTFQSLEIMATSGMTFEVWLCAGMLYLLLGLLSNYTGKGLEKHFSRHIS